jgi:hypothetical protein
MRKVKYHMKVHRKYNLLNVIKCSQVKESKETLAVENNGERKKIRNVDVGNFRCLLMAEWKGENTQRLGYK